MEDKIEDKTEYIFEEIKKDLKTKNYNEMAIEEIININKSNISNDIKSIINETQLEYKDATLLYIKNNYNPMNSICTYLNIKEYTIEQKQKHKNERMQKEEEIKKKIDELRIIANDRDNYYENYKKNKE